MRNSLLVKEKFSNLCNELVYTMKKLIKFMLMLGGISLSFLSYAQRTDIIYFADKVGSSFSISNPQAFLSQRSIDRRVKQNIPIRLSDLPVNARYVDSLKNRGAIVWYTSKWFNAAIIRNATDSMILSYQSLPFVISTERVRRPVRKVNLPVEMPISASPSQQRTGQTLNYGASFNQNAMLGTDIMHSMGFRGQNMLIGVFDSGFPGVDNALPFDSINLRNGIQATYDFVNNVPSVYSGNNHGTLVLSTIGGLVSGSLIGTAPSARFVLCRTEDVASEYRVEEANWLVAAEFADSIGVDLINTSLGYYTFDNPAQDYTYADMNGNTTIISRAADMAASVGILPVASAGNEGASTWRYITAPADGDSVLAVGALQPDSILAGFSSRGPSSDNQIKPNLVAQGAPAVVAFQNGFVGQAFGTSFSGPILCGLAAGFWQANPTFTNMQVLQMLQMSGTRATSPDTLIGYGIPNFSRAMIIAGNPLMKRSNDFTVELLGNPVSSDRIRFQLEGMQDGEAYIACIFDALGRVVVKQSFSATPVVVDWSLAQQNLPKGAYVLMIENNRVRATRKFILE